MTNLFSSRFSRSSVLALCFLILTSVGHTQVVLLIHDSKAPSREDNQLRNLVDSMGLKLELLEITASHPLVLASDLRRSPTKLAILIPAPLLASLDLVLHEQRTRPGKPAIPILVYDIGADTDPALLGRWSDGALSRCSISNHGQRSKTITIVPTPLSPAFSPGYTFRIPVHLYAAW